LSEIKDLKDKDKIRIDITENEQEEPVKKSVEKKEPTP
jgi:hypothetical protein